MSLLSFIKEAGEKLFGKSEPAAAAAPSVEELNQKAGDAIQKYVEEQNLGIVGLDVKFDGASSTATLTGEAPSQEASEKAALCCGNVQNVSAVQNRMSVKAGAPEAKFHDVVKGDTLSAISKKVYGDANKYNIIFEANKPMLKHPDKIYPGQKLRIPPLP
jgi:nucleoid-associated protein YgaU